MIELDLNKWPIVIHKTCQICGSEIIKPLYAVAQTDFSYLMNICKCCGHVQVGRTQLPPEQKKEVAGYFDHYDAKNKNSREKIDADLGGIRYRVFKNILKNLSRMGFAKGNMLDIGSACGHMLNLARLEGYTVLGVEPSALARKFAKENFDINSVANISDLAAGQKFDVICCFETLYYCHDVRDILRKIRQHISEKGCFVLKMRSNRTNIFRLFSAIYRLGNRLLILKPGSLLIKYSLKGYHLFKTKNIERLLRNEGFAVIKTVNEKQIFPRERSIPNLLKIIRCSLTTLVTIGTLGRVKIGTEITVYAALTPATWT